MAPMPPVPRPPKGPKGPKGKGPQQRSEGRNNRVLLIGLGVAAVVVAVIVAGTLLFTGGDGGSSTASTGPNSPVGLVAGIPQNGTTLGKKSATVTMTLFEDLQCPYCRHFTEDALPAIVNEYVKTGRVKLDWRGLHFLGPDSETALKIALAAGKQNKLWEVIGLFYAKQGEENSGWVTDKKIDQILAAVPGLDAAKVKEDANSAAIAKQVAEMTNEAAASQVDATPSFFLQHGVSQPYQIQVDLTPEAFRPALNDALKG